MSEIKQISKLEILNETIQFYSEDTTRRAYIEDEGCLYNTEDGRHCAVGRCLSFEFKKQGIGMFGNSGSNPDDLFIKNGLSSLNDMLQEEYRGHELNFWNQLQFLHDGRENWDSKGLTKIGERKVEEIKELFALGE